MASPLDLQEQEQLDELKAFWKRWGNLITWLLTAALLSYAGYNGWQWWQRDQSLKASAMFDELERAAKAGDADRAGRAFNDLKDRYGRTLYAQQGGLVAAQVLFDKSQPDAALSALGWVADNASEKELATVARLRAAAIHVDAKAYDKALAQLSGANAPTFSGLVADRRGDILAAQGKPDEALAAYRQAWSQIGEQVEYRRLVEAKLTALGAPPEAASAPADGAAK